MDIKGLEERINERGTKSYWKDGIKIAKECTRCKKIKSMEDFYKKSDKNDGRGSCCKECESDKQRESKKYKEYQKEYREKNKDKIKVQRKQYREANKEELAKRSKIWRENNKEKKRESDRRYREAHPNYMKEWHKAHKEHDKQYYLNNQERIIQYRINHKEERSVYDKQRYIDKREENIKEIAEMLKEIKSIITEYNLPIYGVIYRFQNIKTGRCYVGQTIRPLKERYWGGITKGWLRERNEHENQQFKEELTNEEDFILTEVLDVGICKWHLDKIESYYIDKYNAFEDGYNNMPGNYYTTDGLEEFKQILNTYNLEFKDNKIIKKD